jgi:hypothetical protein
MSITQILETKSPVLTEEEFFSSPAEGIWKKPSNVATIWDDEGAPPFAFAYRLNRAEVTVPKVAAVEMLYFGMNSPSGEVTAEEWAEFLKNVVTPRLPKGFTVFDSVSGQWMGASKQVEREATKVMVVTHAFTKKAERAIREIIEAYKKLFRQEAVLRVKTQGTIEF